MFEISLPNIYVENPKARLVKTSDKEGKIIFADCKTKKGKLKCRV